MGLLDSFMGNASESAEKTEGSLKISTKFAPFRLSAMKQDKVNFLISITNETDEAQLVSFDVLVPKNGMIGFDTACVSKHTEKKVGELKPNESKEIAVQIFSSNQTKPGTYQVGINAYAHYLDYTKVIKSLKRQTVLRVV